MQSNFTQLRLVLDATPLSIHVWDSHSEHVMCNRQTLLMFDMPSEKEYLENYHLLSPAYQPDGRDSRIAAMAYSKAAQKTGYQRFFWMHCDINGEEIPTEMVLRQLNIEDEHGQPMIAAFTRDLRPQLASNSEQDPADSFFKSFISDKTLFKAISELSDEWFFSYDIASSMMQFYGKGFEKLGLLDEPQLFPNAFIKAGAVNKEDLPNFMLFCENMKSGIVEPLEVRFNMLDGTERFYKLTYNVTVDKNGQPLYTIGKAIDINEQKSLFQLSQTDQLTNCYNKVTAENLIKEAIATSRDGSHVMFIIDIDNFKAVNDNLGHHYGDMVLSGIAADLHAQFRTVDIIGRIGGDEFIVFVKNMRDLKIIEARAKGIARAFKNTYSGEHGEYKVSGSIGIALYNKDGDNFEDLYKAADKALFQSKLAGKDRYTFYTHDLVDGTMKNRTMLDNATRIANSYFDTVLVSTIFNMINASTDTQMTIDAIMAFIGSRTNSDRCYLFETFDGGKTYDNTYEWCKDGIKPEIDNLKGLTAEILSDFFEDSDGDGVLYSNDLTVLDSEGAYDLMADQGIKSFLHAQTYEKGYVKMFLGLDDCTNTRVWGEKDINSLVYAAKMISIFLTGNQKKNKS